MDLDGTFEQRLAEKYDGLSKRLREAGDYVAENPINTATRSLRSVATDAGLAPATFSRLARVLEYETFEEIREVMRHKIDRRVNSFADRADRLRQGHESGTLNFFEAHCGACLQNIQTLSESIDVHQLNDTVDRLYQSRKVLILGALGSTGIAEYMSYMANFLSDNWHMAGRMGASLGSGLAGLDERDALIIVTKPPFARKSILAAEVARQSGAYVVVITDSHNCPALRHANSGFLIATESPHFYSSYVATVFLVETIIGMLAGRVGPDATKRIAEVENRNRRLEEVRDG
ncbi:DNA-binding transcriptional regulator HexR [Roseovarius litorisediminis]|uniref:DNA-binding transcriptional regulator HexR n=1 Tax=Roseovarius litorisediminis TaxID=1312363 RepID=A0A1Y5SRB3_9RHOB|nr:MurR/RpiR family transcriptional regulator [Roseovarius litorisediminis]SLN44763.1 DNA-binding transcriptional regulator HexR [Roseovarius litorisediminis]